MLYTIDEANKSVVFEIPLSDYLGKGSRYNCTTKQSTEYWLNSLQNYEANLFDNFIDNFDYITDDQVDDNIPEATAVLLAEGYTQEEINLFDDELKLDIKRAMSDAWHSSYEGEWLKKFYHQTQKQIDKDLADALANTPYKLLDDISTQEFINDRFEADHLRLEIAMSDITTWLSDHDLAEYIEDKDFADYFADNALDFTRKPINIEYIDYYGTLGDYDEWLSCFKDYHDDMMTAIDNYRQDEKDKLNNYELAAVNLKPHLEAIGDYVANYLPTEPKATKIKRQINALKSVITN